MINRINIKNFFIILSLSVNINIILIKNNNKHIFYYKNNKCFAYVNGIILTN